MEYSKYFLIVFLYNKCMGEYKNYKGVVLMKMKRFTKVLSFLVTSLLIVSLVGCGSSTTPSAAQKKIVVGFSQVGAESAWRTAMTNNVKTAMAKAGFDLKYSDGQQKQENQIKAVRAFIQQKVDVILLAPVVESGWDAVLKEAKDAKIPVILVNRGISVASGNKEDLYTTFLGPDNIQAGKMAADFLLTQFKDSTKTVNVIELEGTVGASSAVERKQGFDNEIKTSPNFKIIKSECGDFTRSTGKQAMEAMIKSCRASGQTFDALFSHSDDMAIGAEQAMQEAGMKSGKGGITVVSCDGIKDIFNAMIAGNHSATCENPIDYGTPLIGLINKCAAGQAATIQKRIVMQYKIWTADQAAAELPNRVY
jgi:ABC-type sugar transport system substrate-binding protein